MQQKTTISHHKNERINGKTICSYHLNYDQCTITAKSLNKSRNNVVSKEVQAMRQRNEMKDAMITEVSP